eukprot:SAG11_NODE_15892_length_563_cov_1.280172_2_plen_57_part_01
MRPAQVLARHVRAWIYGFSHIEILLRRKISTQKQVKLAIKNKRVESVKLRRLTEIVS